MLLFTSVHNIKQKRQQTLNIPKTLININKLHKMLPSITTVPILYSTPILYHYD